MKKIKEKNLIPTWKFNSSYFSCPRCGWEYPVPLLVRGDIAEKECENCGHSYLVRNK